MRSESFARLILRLSRVVELRIFIMWLLCQLRASHIVVPDVGWGRWGANFVNGTSSFCYGSSPELRISNRKVAGSNPMTGAVTRVLLKNFTWCSWHEVE